ncbi:hypothetical protein [Nitrospirillum amazonense]|uniref:hypothetical protein n=1 Tax=Nitrospirillum amazonense TaxID=28077 RepID=UPI002412AAD3|nr:hypothetical protein [Nitrospirillum amazonense]MDG3443721.1 hypothetical protein [Nitrospirillum amazonense]
MTAQIPARTRYEAAPIHPMNIVHIGYDGFQGSFWYFVQDMTLIQHDPHSAVHCPDVVAWSACDLTTDIRTTQELIQHILPYARIHDELIERMQLERPLADAAAIEAAICSE